MVDRLARYAAPAAAAIVGAEALAYHEPLLRRHAAEYAPDVRRRLALGRFLPATAYVNGQRARALIREQVAAVLRRVDCLLAPTLPIAAPPAAAEEVRIGARTESTRAALLLFTRLVNLSGHPAIAVPCGFSRDGLPLSLQLVGRAFDEAAGPPARARLPAVTQWHARRPPGA